MTRLTFPKALVRRLVEHTRAAPKQASSHAGPIKEPSLFLVKDEGCYLMSCGEPGLYLTQPPNTKHVVVYAKGFDPTIADRGEVWDHCRDKLGGDDFAETIPVTMFDAALADDSATVVVTISASRLAVLSLAPKLDGVERLATLTLLMTGFMRKHAGKIVIVGRKKGNRKAKFWAGPVDQRDKWLANFDRPIVLSGLPIDQAAAKALQRLDA